MNNNGLTQPLCRTIKHHLTTSAATAAPFSKWETLLYHCANAKSLPTTKPFHALMTTTGHLSSPNPTTHFLSLLISAYAQCGHKAYASRLFDQMPQRTRRSYRTMIRMYVEKGSPKNALKLFVELLTSEYFEPDIYTLPFVIRACGELLLLDLGVVVHGLTVVSGFGFDTFIGNSLLAMYMNCGDKGRARSMFNAMRERTVVSWNTMISGYFRNDSTKEALVVFRDMLDGGVEADFATFLSVLPACGYLKELELGKKVHLLVEEKGFGEKLSLRNALMDMYVKCGRMDEARKVFDETRDRDVITWTTMINGYLMSGDVNSAVGLCRLMQFEGVRPNEVTLSSLLAACANVPDMKLGKCLHGWVVRQKLESDVNVETALVDMYAKCNRVELAFRVFSKTSRKRTVPWNSILAGFVHNKLVKEAIVLFKEMLSEAVKPNDATWLSLLPAYAVEADMHQAVSVHSYLIRSGFISKAEISTGLVDIYFKCGGLEYGHKIFNEIPVKDQDIIVWSVIIAGYGKHGRGDVALCLFNQMVQSGVEPNEITFTSVLHACSHAGLVDEGLCLFNFMHEFHPSCLQTDHYTCMVDLLGRSGRLAEAFELIQTMPLQPSHAVWGALLGACVIHENVELGEVAAKWLFELEPENTGNYVLMGKIYAAVGRWKDVESIRRMMKNVGLIKSPAHSAVGVRNG